MRIVSFILNAGAIAAILRHLRGLGRDPRALPEPLAAAGGPSPP